MTDPVDLPLRDIQLPDPISWWPPAPGWWVLMAVVIISIVSILFLLKRHKQYRSSVSFLANLEFQKIKDQFLENNNKQFLIAELSVLLRRVSMSISDRKHTAALTNESWLRFLDQYTENHEFSKGVGRSLINAPYQMTPQFDADELLELVSSWLEKAGTGNMEYRR